jgi:uncharacterized protein YneF (UPF0154 family)
MIWFLVAGGLVSFAAGVAAGMWVVVKAIEVEFGRKQ